MEFSGDIEAFSDVQRKLTEDILAKHGYSDSKVHVEPVGKKGDNYVAAVKRVKAEKNDGECINLVVKIASTQEIARMMTHTVLTFGNETEMYSEVLPKFKQLQKSAGVPEEKHFNYPLYYGAIKENMNEFIVLEDLKVHNFVIQDRLVSLTDDEVKLTLKKMATLHSLSFVLRHKEPELFKKFSKQLKGMWPYLVDASSLKAMEGQILSFLRTDEQRERAGGAIALLYETAVNNRKNDLESDYSVIVHGDCWTNNIMFKYEDGRPSDCMLIDYQLSNPSSPVIDIVYFIFNCTDKETRSANYSHWIEYYYENLDTDLSQYDLRAASVYPRELLDADFKKYGKYCFGVALIMASVLMRDSEESMELALNEDQVKQMIESEDVAGLKELKEASFNRLKSRVQELYDSFVEYDYI